MPFNSNESHASVDKKTYEQDLTALLEFCVETHILRKPHHFQSQVRRILQKFYQRLPFVPQHLRSTSVGTLVSGHADGMGE